MFISLESLFVLNIIGIIPIRFDVLIHLNILLDFFFHCCDLLEFSSIFLKC
jgi:hypothetical protein